MWRVVAITILAGVFLATGVAVGAPDDAVSLPIDLGAEPNASPDHVIVERGDHLWKISERRLGPLVATAEVAAYWRRVIARNTPHLRSGDPDLIYPGEVVELPANP